MHTPQITIIPITPTEFFISAAHESKVSVVSLKTFPTTGTAVDTILLVAFTVTSSALFVTNDWIERIAEKIVSEKPSIQTVEDFKNLDNFSIFICGDKFEIIEKTLLTSNIGIRKFVINFPIIVIVNNITGSIVLTEVILPVEINNVINIGISIYV